MTRGGRRQARRSREAAPHSEPHLRRQETSLRTAPSRRARRGPPSTVLRSRARAQRSRLRTHRTKLRSVAWRIQFSSCCTMSVWVPSQSTGLVARWPLLGRGQHARRGSPVVGVVAPGRSDAADSTLGNGSGPGRFEDVVGSTCATARSGARVAAEGPAAERGAASIRSDAKTAANGAAPSRGLDGLSARTASPPVTTRSPEARTLCASCCMRFRRGVETYAMRLSTRRARPRPGAYAVCRRNA